MENEKFKTEIEEIQNGVNEDAKEIISDGINEGGKMERNNNGGDNGGIKEEGKSNKIETGEVKEGTEVKRGRGRPKGSVKKPFNDTSSEKGTKTPTDDKKSFTDDLSEYKKVEIKNEQINPTVNGEAKIDVSKFISGALFLIAIDSVFPSAICFIMGFIDKKYKFVNKKKLKLTEEEKEELEPLANEVVKLIFGYMPPLQAFLICMSIVYAGKVMLLQEEDFQYPKRKIIQTFNSVKKENEKIKGKNSRK